MTPPPTLRNRLLMAALLAGTGLAGVSVGHGWQAQAQSAGAIEPSRLSHPLPDFVELVKQVKPAVVSITSKMHPQEEEQGMPGMGRGQQLPFGFPFGFQFPQMQPQQRTVEARGSGFLIDADGTIVTNNHVINGATQVSVTLSDGTVLPAKIIGHDKASDLAVLRVKSPHKLPFINLGDSDQAQPGAWVIAVGNPFGLGGTVTAGIVSARGRDIGEGMYDSFIQIDAAINQGNSGGPLFTQDGKVVGVNSAIISPSGGSVGIGFAIPSNTVKSVVAQLEKTGHVTRGYIGVQVEAVTSAMAEALNLPGSNNEDRGALVASVAADGPAAAAGLKEGDVITAVNGQKIANSRDLAITVSQITPGSHASLQVVREGKPQTLQVTIGTLPGDGTGHVALPGNADNQSLGVSLSTITPNLRQQLDLPDSQRGAVITQIKPGSAAEQAGLQPGDVITGVGDKPVSGPNEAGKAIRESLKTRQAVALRILRNGEALFVAISGGLGDQSDAPDDNG